MTARKGWLSTTPLLVASCLLLALAGCAELAPTSFNDYVGPKTDSSEVALEPSDYPEAHGATTQPTLAQTQPSSEPLTLDVKRAVFLSLQNNKAFIVEKYNPLMTHAAEGLFIGKFDPLLNGQASYGHTRAPAGNVNTWSDTDAVAAQIGISQFLPTGTTAALNYSLNAYDPRGIDNTNLELNITQSLLRGAGVDVNLASLRQSRIDTKISLYQLRAFAETLVAQVEQAYWNYVLAGEQIRIVKVSLQVAEQQLSETRERVKVGKLAETEIASAEATVALRQENLINAQSNQETTRLTLARLLSPDSADLWSRDIVATHAPQVPEIPMAEVDRYVKVAMRLRPDLNQARLQIDRDDLEIVKTKNGLLPRLDFFANLGMSGYANTFWNSFGQFGNGYAVAGGISGDYPIGNHVAIAADQRAVYSRDQAIASLANLEQLAQVDVRTAYINVVRLKQQMVATAATERASKQTYEAEVEKFNVGKSTSLLVSTANTNWVQAQIGQVQAVIGCVNALVDLYRLDGSLLARRGIAAPGSTPAEITQKNSKYGSKYPGIK